MPRKDAPVLPSPQISFENSISTSRKSERSAASVHDTDYRQSLRYRNIYIEREDPPVELMRRAQRIISCPRASPEMDDATAKKLRNKARRLQDEAEEEIVQQLAPHIIPAMDEIPDQRLASNADQAWFNSVPVPLDSSILTNPLPLPRPKPVLAFGYSEAAFTRNQLGAIDLLVDDQFGQSYAVPDKKLRFPFLDVEFKSQAKNGTHYVATNQVAGAGAIALIGNMDLMQRSFGMKDFDYNEPQFFSVTMDHAYAQINIHWLRAPIEGGQYSFHVEGLSQHLLRDENGLRAVTRAIKNILDYGADTRLQTFCKALDAYRETVVRNREAANPHSRSRHEAQLGLELEPLQSSQRHQQSQYDQQGYQTFPMSYELQEYGVSGGQQPHGQQGYYDTGIQPPLYASTGHGSSGGQQLSHGQQESQSPAMLPAVPPYEQQGAKSSGAQEPLYEQQGYESRADVQVESTPMYADQVEGSSDVQIDQRPRRKRTTGQTLERTRVYVTKSGRVSSHRRTRFGEYDQMAQSGSSGGRYQLHTYTRGLREYEFSRPLSTLASIDAMSSGSTMSLQLNDPRMS